MRERLKKVEKMRKSKLTPKQRKALPIILAADTLTAGLKEVGISWQCYYNWLEKPEFAEKLKLERERLVKGAYGQLQQAHSLAAEAIIKLLKDKDARLRIRAAESVLDRFMHYVETEELENRLSAIEAKLKEFFDETAKSQTKSGGLDFVKSA